MVVEYSLKFISMIYELQIKIIHLDVTLEFVRKIFKPRNLSDASTYLLHDP